MKHVLQFILLVLCLAALGGQAFAQTAYFDPEHEAIAIRKDSVTQLLVSEYLLAKSIKARTGPGCRILRVYKARSAANEDILMAEGVFLNDLPQPFIISIPLVADAQNRLLYAGAQALVCSTPGCNNCSIQNGNCVGCCTTASGRGSVLQTPMLKIPLTLEE